MSINDSFYRNRILLKVIAKWNISVFCTSQTTLKASYKWEWAFELSSIQNTKNLSEVNHKSPLLMVVRNKISMGRNIPAKLSASCRFTVNSRCRDSTRCSACQIYIRHEGDWFWRIWKQGMLHTRTMRYFTSDSKTDQEIFFSWAERELDLLG